MFISFVKFYFFIFCNLFDGNWWWNIGGIYKLFTELLSKQGVTHKPRVFLCKPCYHPQQHFISSVFYNHTLRKRISFYQCKKKKWKINNKNGVIHYITFLGLFFDIFYCIEDRISLWITLTQWWLLIMWDIEEISVFQYRRCEAVEWIKKEKRGMNSSWCISWQWSVYIKYEMRTLTYLALHKPNIFFKFSIFNICIRLYIIWLSISIFCARFAVIFHSLC